MPQPIFPGVPAGSGHLVDEQPPPATALPEGSSSGELPAERSKFSRWLASFGLGENPIPLLRPRKSPRHPG